jgi:hypothetical protein
MSPKPRADRQFDQQVDDALDSIRAVVQMAANVHSEFLTLLTKRTAAYVDLPRQVLACKSPSDLAEEQVKFLSTMQRNYADYAETVLHMAQPIIEQAERGTAGDGKGQTVQSQREQKSQAA